MLGVFGVYTTVASDLLNGRLEDVFGQTCLFEDRGDRRVLDEGKEDMVLGDLGIVHVLPERVGLANDFGGGRAERGFIGRW